MDKIVQRVREKLVDKIGLTKRETIEWAAETFGVRIDSGEIDRLRTLRDLHDLVLARLAGAMPAAEGTRAGRCLSSYAFYRVRRALMEVCGVERRQVRPDTKLRDLLPRRNRHRVWQQLREHSGLPLPGLEPAVLSAIAVMALPVLLVPYGFMAAAPENWRAGALLLAVVLVLIADWSPLNRLATRLAPVLPAPTVRDLLRLTFVFGYGQVARQTGAWNEREVRDAIYVMVAEASGLAWVDCEDTISLDDTFEYWVGS